jgi:hypothetical protein
MVELTKYSISNLDINKSIHRYQKLNNDLPNSDKKSKSGDPKTLKFAWRGLFIKIYITMRKLFKKAVNNLENNKV